MNLPYLPTKLNCRAPLPHQIRRPHLIVQLNQALALGHKLTLAVAPAGFGKTTLISQWIDDLRAQRVPRIDNTRQEAATSGSLTCKSKILNFAWLSLDEYDNDLTLFLHYFVAALRNVFPASCTHTLHLLQAPQLPPLPYLTTILGGELAELPEECILVLEDYHFIAEATIHQLLTRLLDHLPQQLHLVLISRMEPPLSLARLRVQQQMTELRAVDLCFSFAETQAFLAQILGKSPAQETIIALHAQTEGWVAGLQLAALSLRGRADEPAFAQTLKRSNRHVMDYLLDEVFARQPPTVQAFLLRTAILERLCAPLCEAVLAIGNGRSEIGTGQSQAPMIGDQSSSQKILNYLERANLFLIPLDDQGEWYRYHHLFQELLRHQLQSRLSAAEIEVLRRQASIWLAGQGSIEEALQQVLTGGDALAAAQLVEQHQHELLNREDWRTLERWLSMLPEALVKQRPGLLIVQAFLFFLQNQWAATRTCLQAVEDCLAIADPAATGVMVLRGEMDALWSQICTGPDKIERSLVYAQRALERLPARHLYARSLALLALGLDLHQLGQTIVAVQTLQVALEPHLARPNTFTTRVLFGLVQIYYLAGAFPRMYQTAQTFWRIATQAKLALSIGWSHYSLGLVAYEWNELASAVQHFSAVVEQRYSVHRLAACFGWLGLAWTYQMQGRFDQARQQVAALRHFLQEMNDLTFLPQIESFEARLARLQGDGAAARRWIQASDLDPTLGSLTSFELPYLTRAKILLDQGTAASVAEASQGLEQLRAVAEASHVPMRLIEILALQALAAAAQGQTESALAFLKQAVVLAKPGRFIRTFVDLGPPLAGLFYQLAARGFEAEYLCQVLAIFPLIPDAADPARHIQRAAQTNLVVPLTERELEVLALLARRFSNQEIAQTLIISSLTVKRHTTNLYGKLQVENRKQAIAKAKALGILPADDTP